MTHHTQQFVRSHGGDAARAIQAIADDYGIAVSTQSRSTLEDALGRPLLDQEWDRIRPAMRHYHAWLTCSGAVESLSAWTDQQLDGLPRECDLCGAPMFVTGDGISHHVDSTGGPATVEGITVDHDADGDHTPYDAFFTTDDLCAGPDCHTPSMTAGATTGTAAPAPTSSTTTAATATSVTPTAPSARTTRRSTP